MARIDLGSRLLTGYMRVQILQGVFNNGSSEEPDLLLATDRSGVIPQGFSARRGCLARFRRPTPPRESQLKLDTALGGLDYTAHVNVNVSSHSSAD